MPHFDVPSSNRRNARRMRRQMTDAELRFWNAVRAHRLDRLGFRRQLPISGYIADFACPALRLVIEIDGAGHTEDRMIRKDAERDRRLRELDWSVLRLSNEDVERRLDEVRTHILRIAADRRNALRQDTPPSVTS
ncbi:very-short-patch-repair endonuclease [Ciceribacter lividus]|uniref:Very-short-patch-repair endonuclease n=2 Tax=Ciceribacter lividus TaxID=1197950 RepID=A0A6I7HK57_9HYPH|nr:endonuclease domain-containing protein [Ciceribacter lividus]RCW21608.1 very-short-patch-repair endonuclease [Ciceribacter lividus]